MTWYWDVVDSNLVVWDHTQDPATDDPYRTLTSEEGWTWTDYPDDVLAVMHDRCATLREDLQRGGGSSPIDINKIVEYFAIIEDMAGEQIERAE